MPLGVPAILSQGVRLYPLLFKSIFKRNAHNAYLCAKNTRMILLDGTKLSEQIKDELRVEVAALRIQGHRRPHLLAIVLGDYPASHTYVQNKMRACESIGIQSSKLHLPYETSEEALLDMIDAFNADDEIDGIIVQMPMPEHISTEKVFLHMDPLKDVDGFHPFNIGMLTQNYFPAMLPATPSGILEMLARYNIPTKGKHCVVVGRSRIVGRPTSILMSRGGYPGEATVTLCHKYTPAEELHKLCPLGDIVIVAVGKPGLITADMIKDGAVVIDVGITPVAAPGTKSGYRLRGDVDFESVAPKCSYITPVPGGVGPMTVVMLIKNTVEAYKRRKHLSEEGNESIGYDPD